MYLYIILSVCTCFIQNPVSMNWQPLIVIDDPNCAMLRHDNFERRNQVQKSIKNQMNVVRERRSWLIHVILFYQPGNDVSQRINRARHFIRAASSSLNRTEVIEYFTTLRLFQTYKILQSCSLNILDANIFAGWGCSSHGYIRHSEYWKHQSNSKTLHRSW